MATQATPNIEAGAVLARMLDRQGLSANAASKATGGVVSATTVRGYRVGKAVTTNRLLALAQVLGTHDGAEMLRAYGLDDAAESFIHRAESVPIAPVKEPEPPETPPGIAEVVRTLTDYLHDMEARIEALEANAARQTRKKR